jgi:transcriptional regulator with XRE-family HTH domain
VAKSSLPPLAQLLTDLRSESGFSLREVEKETDGVVSNVYLSQLEHGRRADPNPRILVALARVYGCPLQDLFEAAGYVDAPSPTAIDIAFEQVLADPKFQFGTRARQGELDQQAKRAIVELYEQVTGKKLLTDGEG